MSSSEDEDGDWREDPEPDPPSLGPGVPEVDVPEVEVPTPDTATGGADVDTETAATFWRLVLVFDVALLALALGPMFVYFRGELARGAMLIGFGVLAFGYGVLRYREFRDGEPAEDESDDAGSGEGSIEGASDAGGTDTSDGTGASDRE